MADRPQLPEEHLRKKKKNSPRKKRKSPRRRKKSLRRKKSPRKKKSSLKRVADIPAAPLAAEDILTSPPGPATRTSRGRYPSCRQPAS
jgi:hypothetical protein